MTKLMPTVHTSESGVRAEISLISSENGIDIFRINITFPENTAPSRVTVKWEEEFLNNLYTWSPSAGRNLAIHQWFGPARNDSNFCIGAPILSAIGADGLNTATVSVSDVCTPIEITFAGKNSKRGENLADYQVHFFSAPADPIVNYTADIRIDRRTVPFYEAVMSVYPWWTEHGHAVPPCPSAAEDALYSTWYSCYQNPVGKDILADLKVASEAGFKTVILDDGWQFEGLDGCGYGKCGDWLPAGDKFPDFKAFTDGVHALGMKLMVWFAVPFVGLKSKAYELFKDKILYKQDWLQCATLDPRYPEVRKYTKDIYKRFLKAYDIDGFKLDFIDAFRPGDEMAAFDPAAMDCDTIETAVRVLLEEITAELAEIKPNLLYEYRQRYIGPAINRFGNMLRVGDCAYDALQNRIGMVNLRLMNYPLAVHSDMLCWSPKEDPKLCAKQLLNVLFCVPQISVFLADISEEQKKLLKHYLDYWTANRDILLHGKFCALNPEYNYTVVSAEGEDKIITALYADTPYTYTGKACDIHLNGNRDGLAFENPTNNVLKGKIYDCFGTLLETIDIGANTFVRLPVPETGMLAVK